MNINKKLLVGAVAGAMIGGSAFAITDRTLNAIKISMQAAIDATVDSVLSENLASHSGAVASAQDVQTEHGVTVSNVTIASDGTSVLTTTLTFSDPQTQNTLASVEFTSDYAAGTVPDADDIYKSCTYTAGTEIASGIPGMTNTNEFVKLELRAIMKNLYNCTPA